MGASVWLAAAPSLAHALGYHLGGWELAASTFVAAGASLLPDIDHPTATLARSVGPVTKVIAHVVELVAGGHRKGTHSALFCLLAGGLAAVLATQVGLIGNAALFFALAYVGMVTLGVSVSRDTPLGDAIFLAQAAVLTALAVGIIPGDWWWMPWAVGGGCALHLAGDFLTDGGIPLWWPFSNRRYSLPLFGETGQRLESVGVATAFSVFLVWVTVAAAVDQPWWTTAWIQ